MPKKKEKTMLEVTKGYEKFIANKDLNSKGKDQFEKVLKKVARPKQRGSK